MEWTEISAGELHAAEQRLRVAFGNEADNIVREINSNQKFVSRIVRSIVSSKNGADEKAINVLLRWLCAREIMGKNFFGVEEAIKHLGISPSQEQAALLSEIPFSEAVLQETKDSHILVAVFPPSIKEIRSRVERKLFCSHEDAWYNSQEFAQKTGKTQWMLIQKTPVPNSTSKTWQEQQALLGKKEEIPTAQAMVYTIIGHYLNTAERLFEKIYVRTSYLDSGGRHVDVGIFDSSGLVVDGYWGDNRDGVIAVSSSRKS
jgi:hypothetical protein